MVSTLYMKLGGSFPLIKYTYTHTHNYKTLMIKLKKKNRRMVNIYSAVGNKVLF